MSRDSPCLVGRFSFFKKIEYHTDLKEFVAVFCGKIGAVALKDEDFCGHVKKAN